MVLADRSVSRYHARLTATGDELMLEDLGSKNGTRVDGQPVRRITLAAGAEIRFGKLSLRLERVDREDTEVALVVGTPESALEAGLGAALPSGPAETRHTRLTEDGGLEADWLPGLEMALAQTAAAKVPAVGTEQLAPLILGKLVEALQLRGALLSELSSVEDPTVVAKVGELPLADATVLQTLATKLDECSPGQVVFGGAEGDSTQAWAAVIPAGRTPLALALVGAPGGIAQPRSLLRMTLRILQLCALGKTPERQPPGPPKELPELRFPPGFVVGSSPAMAGVLAEVQSVLQSAAPILITGETGTGKEVIAQLIQRSSDRASLPFEAINCAAIPADLLEAEMFGVAPGAATGVRSRPGLLARAGDGILFLDEVGDLALELQAKLLRALQEKEIQPVGGRPVSFAARIIAATNRDLEQAMAEGSLRRDLYYRLAACELALPPLRARLEDLQPLLAHFLRGFARGGGKHVPGVTRKALVALERWHWPGNIRELEHVARRLVRRAVGGRPIEWSQLEGRFQALAPSPESATAGGGATDEFDLKANVQALERDLVQRALEACAGNRSQAARRLGIARNTLAKKLEELG
nr:regulatory protein AtoC-like [Nerophis lumbriciformis]